MQVNDGRAVIGTRVGGHSGPLRARFSAYSGRSARPARVNGVGRGARPRTSAAARPLIRGPVGGHMDGWGGRQAGSPISTTTASGRAASSLVTTSRAAGYLCASRTTTTSGRPAASASAALAAWAGSPATAPTPSRTMLSAGTHGSRPHGTVPAAACLSLQRRRARLGAEPLRGGAKRAVSLRQQRRRTVPIAREGAAWNDGQERQACCAS
jgi:hypothetical protein